MVHIEDDDGDHSLARSWLRILNCIQLGVGWGGTEVFPVSDTIGYEL